MKSHRLLKAVTGVTRQEFEALLVLFESVWEASRYQGIRKRAPGAGRKGVLKSLAHQLFFLLFYLKVYPTYDVGSVLWGVDRSRICRWVQKGLPLWEQALGHALVLPKRRVRSVAEF